jgi:hypothetical protein
MHGRRARKPRGESTPHPEGIGRFRSGLTASPASVKPTNTDASMTSSRGLGRIPLLAIDEVGYIPFDGKRPPCSFQLISSRDEGGQFWTVVDRMSRGQAGRFHLSNRPHLVGLDCYPKMRRPKRGSLRDLREIPLRASAATTTLAPDSLGRETGTAHEESDRTVHLEYSQAFGSCQSVRCSFIRS